ncbi:hypothetical protein [Micrococcus sp.]|uniref:hypothetical protein n=1 Tax=Micrococcus sp. TaxID=1271 RepID=UPI0026DD0FA6|nr:hypothetical protein [Micrococcus sp.]MDO4239102.1 hypothetical protein [Micrococcus sp.]
MTRSPVRTALAAGALLASPVVTCPVILALTAPDGERTLPDGTAPGPGLTDALFLAALVLPAVGVAVLATGTSPRRGLWASLASACLAAALVGLLAGSLAPAPLAYVGGWLALAGPALLALLGGGLLIGGTISALEDRAG